MLDEFAILIHAIFIGMIKRRRQRFFKRGWQELFFSILFLFLRLGLNTRTMMLRLCIW